MLIDELLKQKKKLHFSLIDPDKQNPLESASLAKICTEYGTDAIMVGGSTGISSDLIDKTVRSIRDATNLPIILFPNSSNCISKNADYIFFMSLLNSNNPKYIIKEQANAAMFINRSTIKPISVGYIVISTSKTPTQVEKKGDLDKIKDTDTTKALNYALAAKYLGIKYLYLEAGSGADKPIPTKMITLIKKETNLPLIVGGGVRDETIAREIVEAGADIIVTGTVIEKNIIKLKQIIRAIR